MWNCNCSMVWRSTDWALSSMWRYGFVNIWDQPLRLAVLRDSSSRNAIWWVQKTDSCNDEAWYHSIYNNGIWLLAIWHLRRWKVKWRNGSWLLFRREDGEFKWNWEIGNNRFSKVVEDSSSVETDVVSCNWASLAHLVTNMMFMMFMMNKMIMMIMMNKMIMILMRLILVKHLAPLLFGGCSNQVWLKIQSVNREDAWGPDQQINLKNMMLMMK